MTTDVREYETDDGRSPFADWFEELDAQAAAKVTTALTRLEQGNMSRVKGVGSGVFELKVDFGPGYRVCFGKDGSKIVIILLAASCVQAQSAGHVGTLEGSVRDPSGAPLGVLPRDPPP